ncbi:MAG: efflux RND transporter periplasmic adaptor subunit [bacterium]
MRKYLSFIIGLIIVALGILAFNLMSKKEVLQITESKDNRISINVTKVKLTDIPYNIEATGTLVAKESVELYSEVQGVLLPISKGFKLGNRYFKGQTIIAIDSREHLASIKSSRSDLINQLASMLPDMELDYPEAYKKWEQYLQSIDVNKPMPALPQYTSNSEKLFVSGKSIYKTFYTIKNMEERLAKYSIRAPFNGIVTEANVAVGTLVRSGQKLGELIDNSSFELQLSIPATENKYLNKGRKVQVNTIDGVEQFEGIITRVNGKIDQDTQAITIVVELNDSSLKDGQYLTANIQGEVLRNVFKIDNSLLLENNQVYIVENNKLVLKPIKVVNYQSGKTVIKGLNDGEYLVTQTIANAYPGMLVTVNN